MGGEGYNGSGAMSTRSIFLSHFRFRSREPFTRLLSSDAMMNKNHSSEISAPYKWFTAENLRSLGFQRTVSKKPRSLPYLPTTTLQLREKMFLERDKMIETSEGKIAERAGRRAAVLVPLCFTEGKPAVLFTVRSQLVSTHKGQVTTVPHNPD